MVTGQRPCPGPVDFANGIKHFLFSEGRGGYKIRWMFCSVTECKKSSVYFVRTTLSREKQTVETLPEWNNSEKS